MLACVLCGAWATRLDAQEAASKKQLQAWRLQGDIKIDGQLSEPHWLQAPPATHFIQIEPEPGQPAAFPTEVRVLYDDDAIYIGAICHDPHPDSILQELSERDNFGNTDWFGLSIDAYRDGLNGLGFFVTPRGVQFDLKYNEATSRRGGPGNSVFRGDRNWDAVWAAETRITPQGWIVEMRIPYAALRFPTAPEQTWHINFVRHIRRYRQTAFWNPVDPEQSGLLIQSGLLTGIRNVKSPIRLSATPFIATYVENYYDRTATPSASWGRSISGGMDVKYGINDAFTLDMTLVPDFGEARSDNQVLNLSPFEVRFDENRQFFTEGTELFNRAGLFYSRRVGGRPYYYSEVYHRLSEGETLIDNPAQVQLINATKVSGRTNSGLGIGLFNAMAGRTYATISSTDGTTRKEQTHPLTNYNVLVFDQNLPHNSYVALVNTNVWREGAAHEANVSGTEFQLRDKRNTYALSGKAVLSQLYYPDSTSLGHAWSARMARISGRWQWQVAYNEESPTYQINDLGFLRSPNERSVRANLRFRQFQPFGKFNNAGASLNLDYERLYAPDVFTRLGLSLWAWATSRSFFHLGINLRAEPAGMHDYFEARTPARVFVRPASYRVGSWFSSDFRKRLAVSGNGGYRKWTETGYQEFNVSVRPRFRVNDRLTFQLSIDNRRVFNEAGYVGHTPAAAAQYDLASAGTFYRILSSGGVGFELLPDDAIVFGRRDQNTFVNELSATFAFSNAMTLSFRARHYWSSVRYRSFALLEATGNLQPSPYQGVDDKGMPLHDLNFNVFNIDAVWRWRFAPGSDLFVVWKNQIFRSEADTATDYLYNLAHLLDAPQSNSLSVKAIYYLDYNHLVR